MRVLCQKVVLNEAIRKLDGANTDIDLSTPADQIVRDRMTGEKNDLTRGPVRRDIGEDRLVER